MCASARCAKRTFCRGRGRNMTRDPSDKSLRIRCVHDRGKRCKCMHYAHAFDECHIVPNSAWGAAHTLPHPSFDELDASRPTLRQTFTKSETQGKVLRRSAAILNLVIVMFNIVNRYHSYLFI